MNWGSSICARCFRRIAQCNLEDVKLAAIEVAVICISAFVPLWAGMFFFSLTDQAGSAVSYGNSFMISGEMLLISCAMIGPLIYIVTRKYGKFIDPLTIRFPYSTGFSVVIVMIWFISGGIFISKKATDLRGIHLFADNAMWDLSFVVTAGAVVILLLATIFRNCMDRADPSGMMRADEEQFLRDFENE